LVGWLTGKKPASPAEPTAEAPKAPASPDDPFAETRREAKPGAKMTIAPPPPTSPEAIRPAVKIEPDAGPTNKMQEQAPKIGETKPFNVGNLVYPTPARPGQLKPPSIGPMTPLPLPDSTGPAHADGGLINAPESGEALGPGHHAPEAHDHATHAPLDELSSAPVPQFGPVPETPAVIASKPGTPFPPPFAEAPTPIHKKLPPAQSTVSSTGLRVAVRPSTEMPVPAPAAAPPPPTSMATNPSSVPKLEPTLEDLQSAESSGGESSPDISHEKLIEPPRATAQVVADQNPDLVMEALPETPGDLILEQYRAALPPTALAGAVSEPARTTTPLPEGDESVAHAVGASIPLEPKPAPAADQPAQFRKNPFVLPPSAYGAKEPYSMSTNTHGLPMAPIPVPASGAGFHSEAILARFDLEPKGMPRPSTAPPIDYGMDIPQEYGDTELVLLVRDPEWMFAYWEINEADRLRFGLHRGRAAKPMAIRLYDITVGGPGLNGYVDIPVQPDASNWYLRMAPNRAYQADIGFYDELGRFVGVARSNGVNTPRNEPSDDVGEDTFMIVQEDFEKIFTASGGRVITREQIGSQFVTRVAETTRSLPGLLTVPFGSSDKRFVAPFLGASNMSSASGGVAGKKYGSRAKDFWLRVRTELILYGQTEPDAQVTVQGQPVALRPDGSFTMRYAFPDGVIEMPVVATNADGDMTKSITPVAERSTHSIDL